MEVKLLNFNSDTSPKEDKVNKLNKDTGIYISQIIDIYDENQINIAMPMCGSRLVPLNVDNVCELYFYSKNGLFKANGRVEARNKDNNILNARVRLITDLEKIQRRKYFRLEHTFDVAFREINAREILLMKLLDSDTLQEEKRLKIEEELININSNWNKATLTDLSGGGARFISSTLYPKETILKLKLNLELCNEVKIIEVKSKILYAIKIPEVLNKNELRVEFLDISEKTRELIIKFIFDKQRELIKNV